MIRNVKSQFQKLHEIPEDIIIDILVRLQNMVQFDQNPYFYIQASQPMYCISVRTPKGYKHVLSFRSNGESARVLSPDLELPACLDKRVYVVGSCNGIVCFYDTSSTILLSNPITREFKQLPPSSIKSNMKLFPLGLGLGFDSQNIYDFKVLRVVSSSMIFPKEYRAEMYTLSSNTWRQIEYGLDETLLLYIAHRGLFFRNSFHFSAMNSYKYSIVSCDIHTERSERMELPMNNDHAVSDWLTSLVVVKEFLSLVFRQSHFLFEGKWIEIWIMKDYGVVESWTKLYSIGPSLEFDHSSCFSVDDHALLLFQEATGTILRCSLHTIDLDLESIVICGYNSQVVVVKEALVSIM